MRVELTSVDQGAQEGSVNDLRSLAINAARLIRSLSNHRPEDLSCAAIALVRVERRKGIEGYFRLNSNEAIRFSAVKTQTNN